MAESIYESLGVRTVIDAWGTVTALGGSLMAPEVLQAMQSAAGRLRGHERAAHGSRPAHRRPPRRGSLLRHLRRSCRACHCGGRLHDGTRRSYAYQLPDTTGMKDEILCLKCHRDLYDQGMLLSGAHFVEIGVTSSAFLQQIEDRITERTAAFFYTSEAETMRGSIPLPEIAALCRAHGIPIIVDAAAELPPKANIRKYLDDGASLVVFSGGKEIRGPQASGMILGSPRADRRVRAQLLPELRHWPPHEGRQREHLRPCQGGGAVRAARL